MKKTKTYSRGEPMPVAATGSAKLLRKINKLHPMVFNTAMKALLKREQKSKRP